MPVKYWSFAGLVLTYWCNARCASCYLSCSPQRRRWFGLDEAIRVWGSLIDACPHGCRIHISGGEPFGRWRLLIELCRRAKQQALAPLEKVETNAFWAADEGIIRDRLLALDAADMRKLVISADPYHQQFVPIERCRLLARVAEEVLGPHRIQVRWRDWLADGFDTDGLGESQRSRLFAQYAAKGRDRLNGRAAALLAGHLRGKSAPQFDGRDRQPCAEQLLRSRHVHVGPDGLVMPGVCAGIILGSVGAEGTGPGAAGGTAGVEKSISAVWRGLSAAFEADREPRAAEERYPVISALARSGPGGLLASAREQGFIPAERYAGKCHLCWDVRRFFVSRGMHRSELGPAWLYGLEGGRGTC